MAWIIILQHNYLQAHKLTSIIFIQSLLYFIFYYSFIQYSTKNISKLFYQNYDEVIKISKVSIIIGLITVIGMFLLTVIINNFGIIFLLTNGISLNINILLFALLYYVIRVFRDVILIILRCTDFIKKSIIIHLIELSIVILLLNYFVPKYQINGLFLSFSVASLMGILFFTIYFRKLKF